MSIKVRSIKLLGTDVEFNRFIRKSGYHLLLGPGHTDLCTNSNRIIGTLLPSDPLDNSWTLKLNDSAAMGNALAIIEQDTSGQTSRIKEAIKWT